MSIGARVPAGHTSMDFALKMLDEIGVVLMPGVGFGRYGEGYIHLSLTTPDDRVEKGIRRLTEWRL
ncbi:MAG TPA: hypothetical protein VJ256_05725 [Dehalococcoidia bacterium]|nr:hypothetical protein [Dehalococcoidia bacterium]